MVSVLFVDNNVAGLDVLRNRFGACNDTWQVAFVPGAEVALHVMADRQVDALVANSRLTGMTAAQLFKASKSEHPRVARIALSEPNDRGGMLSTLPVANKCLSSVCGTEVLNLTVEHTTRLQAKLYSDATRKMVADIGGLPSLPATLAAMDATLADEDSSLGQVAEIISSDVAMVARVLQLVNSSFYGLRSEVRDLRQAVSFLGIEALREVAVAGSAFRAFTPSALLPAEWLALFNGHSLAVGDVAGQLARSGPGRHRESGVAGTLHALGELVVAERAPGKLLAIADEVAQGASADDAETAHLGTTFPTIGAYLLSSWGMSYEIVEAIATQREVWDGPPRETQLADLVILADYLVAQGREAGAPDRLVCPASRTVPIDEQYQATVGLLGSVRLYHQGFKALR